MMDKAALRRMIRDRKRQMTPEQIQLASIRLGEKFLQHPFYRAAKTIYGYLPYNQEVQTVPMLQQALQEGKRIAVPKIYGDEMKFIYIDDFSKLENNRWGIPEPVADGPMGDDPEALVLMPGLAFDEAGHRIGYGGGFYDRFLAAETKHPTLALCYGFQLFPSLETEEFDIPVDCVIWE